MPKKFLTEWILKIEKQLLKKKIKCQGELTLVFLNKTAAKKINFKFRKKNYATDVLSFKSELAFGELVMCPEVILKQSKANSHSFQAELGYMVLHGILHLLGYDHEGSRAEAKKMFQLQDGIYAKISHTDKQGQ